MQGQFAEGSGKANQNANAGQSNNESHGLKAQLIFTPVDCTTGEAAGED